MSLGQVPEQATRKRIDAFLTGLSQFGYAGTVHAFDHGREIFSGGYGFSNRASRYRNERNTLFDIGSLAKSITATAVLQLQERSKLNIQDTIDKYLPDVPIDKRGITVRQLLSHTAGLDSDFPFKNPAAGYYEDVSRDDAVK